jgi:hypothetical protein
VHLALLGGDLSAKCLAGSAVFINNQVTVTLSNNDIKNNSTILEQQLLTTAIPLT